MNKEQFTAEVLKAEKSLYHIARSILKCDEDCADAMQNAILQAYRHLDSLKEEAYFRTWLTRILMNECYRIIRESKASVSYEEYMEGREEAAPGQQSPVYEAVMELPENYRIPFTLHYVEGYSMKETGKLLRISESAVKVRLHRARKLLREQLKGEYDL